MSNDYTACSGEGCQIKHSCHRFTGPKSQYRQSMFVEPPMEIIDDWFYCGYFWDNKVEKEDLKKLDEFITKDFIKFGDVFQKLADYDKK